MPLEDNIGLVPNSAAYESQPLIRDTGFREYDARWIFGADLNLAGVQTIGEALGSMVQDNITSRRIVVGHDFRSYSSSIKYALITGLMNAGCHVHDIGLCTTPMAYYAQFALDCPAVAMVTASHNENGWTGIKMGLEKALTFGPELMQELRRRAISGQKAGAGGGRLIKEQDFAAVYHAHLTTAHRLNRKIRVGAVCGNGTAGAFAPSILRDIGCDVTEIDCKLDYTFPNYNPNPEDLRMLAVMKDAVRTHKLDVAFGFDGDGDRCGVVDNTGRVIYADKLGLMLARDLAAKAPGSTFVVDVKSTGLFRTDPVLAKLNTTVDYWKTGHSYIKRRTAELDARAGFEKSGHFFFRPPFGLGYDDGILSAVAVCAMLDAAPDKSLGALYAELPPSFSTPTMSPHCDDNQKYRVVAAIAEQIKGDMRSCLPVAGQPIIDISEINGIRFTFADGSWGLVRASSNKPELVVVCESMTAESQTKTIFEYIRSLLAKHPEVGEFNQTLA